MSEHSASREFHYAEAFARNLGWFTEADQLTLRAKTVAIAGLGGVGGPHLLSLVRLGIGGFHIADLDKFDLVNFNRQPGATMQTIGLPKADVMAEMALSINPELRLVRFEKGVTSETVDAFLEGVDLYVDGLDFFAIDIRRLVFQRCRELGRPAVTAAPVGMGTSYLVFLPGGMSFEQYFRLEGRPPLEQYLRFLLGIVPKALHRSYLVDPTRLDLEAKAAPSTIAGCQLAAGVVATIAVKILLGRGDVRAAPWSQHFDAYRGILASSRLRFGLNGPLQRLKIRLAMPAIRAIAARPISQPPLFRATDDIDEILNAARWTPSGDNEQPWRFERVGLETVLVHLAPPDPANPYHYRDDEPNVLSLGMLLESIAIAAAQYRRRMTWMIEAGNRLSLRIEFAADPLIRPDPLFSVLAQRSVDRTPYRLRPLTNDEREALASAVAGGLLLDWYTSWRMRWRIARLSARATSIRLRAPETYPVHQRIIDWQASLSASRIPSTALGVSGLTRRIIQWALQSFDRRRWLNSLGGTLSAALEMDFSPILRSSGVFTLRIPQHLDRSDIATILESGRAVQRFWLTAARLGLAVQPELAVLIFAHYGEVQTALSADRRVQRDTVRLARAFRDTFELPTSSFVFMGRIGEPVRKVGVSRSLRRPLHDLSDAPHT